VSDLRVPARLACGLGLLVVLLVAGCAVSGPPTGPRTRATVLGSTSLAVGDGQPAAPDTPAPIATSVLPTGTPTTTPTATPSPTPTPPAAAALGPLPAGQIVFGTSRAGNAGQELWLADRHGGLSLLRDDVAGDLWDCVPADPWACVVATTESALLAILPGQPAPLLLDQLELPQPGADQTGDTPNPWRLSLAPGGTRVALAAPGSLRVYDLAAQRMEATIELDQVLDLAWSPGGADLALVYPLADLKVLAIWNAESGRQRIVAQMDTLEHLVWSPDGRKLAYDAFQAPRKPDRQSALPDVYVADLDTGEFRNFTEVYLRNRTARPENRVGAWAPSWEAEGTVLRYLRGQPDQPDRQSLVRHPWKARNGTVLWSVAESGVVGVAEAPDGRQQARVVDRDGVLFLQVRDGEDPWRDLAGLDVDETAVHTLSWAPDAQPAGSQESAEAGPSRYLWLLLDRQVLLADTEEDTAEIVIQACPDCRISRAPWTWSLSENAP